jgi:hypothetical protein
MSSSFQGLAREGKGWAGLGWACPTSPHFTLYLLALPCYQQLALLLLLLLLALALVLGLARFPP